MSRTPASDPFTPGYGAVPAVWAGRQTEFAEHEVLVARVTAGTYEQARLITGDRGVGKTAFLAALEDEAREAGQWVVRIAATREGGLAADLAEVLAGEVRDHSAAARVTDRLAAALDALGGVEVGAKGVRVERRERRDRAPAARELSAALVEAGRMAEAGATALLLMVDEAQNTPERDFSTLWHALQAAQTTARTEHGPRGERLRRHLPLGVYVAGLPGLVELGRRAGVTFSERVRHLDFGLLAAADVRAALHALARNEDVGFDSLALDDLVTEVGGYPYFLHLLGTHVWRAGDSPVITRRDVDRGLAAAAVDLERFYDERLRPLGDLQHEWLVTAARLPEDDRTVGAVAAALGRTTSALGSTFAGLTAHGLVRRATGRGRFAFAVPGLDRHLRGLPTTAS